MVASQLNKEVNYPERKKPDEDPEFKSSIYLTEILNTEVLITLGNVRYTFINKDIIFYPIYIMKNKKVKMQVGIYEMKSTHHPSIFDEEGDVDPDKIGEPLLFSFVTPEFIESYSTLLDNKTPINNTIHKEKDKEKENQMESDAAGIDLEEDDDDDDEDIPDYDQIASNIANLSNSRRKKKNHDQQQQIHWSKSLFEDIPKFKTLPSLREETEDINDDIMNRYAPSDDDHWISQFMKNPNYLVQENHEVGDCLFSCIKDAFTFVGKQTTISKLRTLLSNEADEATYQQNKMYYDTLVANQIAYESELRELKTNHKKFRDEFTAAKTHDQQITLVNLAKSTKSRIEDLTFELKRTKELIDEFEFMRDVKSVDDLRRVITTCKFWANQWALSTLERVLNIKLIIFDVDAYNNKDHHGVLQCGTLNDGPLEQNYQFRPDYYILLENSDGSHYKLITYRDKGIFKFKEIPFGVKFSIIQKCMERNGGPFDHLPDFVHLKHSLLGPDGEITAQAQSELDRMESWDEIKNADNNTLYNPDIVFQFYSKSDSKPAPGHGSGEKIDPNNPELELKYAVLSKKYPEWRKMLSNFWISPFSLDGHKWNSVEHYYQASKFKIYHPDFYKQFSLNANKSDLNIDPGVAKAAGGKTGKMKKNKQVVVLRPSNIKIDNGFFENGRDKIEMEKAMEAKFTQSPELKDMLIHTFDAKLTHFVRGGKPVVFTELMKVRKSLIN